MVRAADGHGHALVSVRAVVKACVASPPSVAGEQQRCLRPHPSIGVVLGETLDRGEGLSIERTSPEQRHGGSANLGRGVVLDPIDDVGRPAVLAPLKHVPDQNLRIGSVEIHGCVV